MRDRAAEAEPSEVKVAQLCPTLCNPVDYTVHGIFQARILEWVAFPFSRGSSQPRDRTWVSCIAGGFFTTEPLRKPRVKQFILGSLARVLEWVAIPSSRGIFPTQGSNPGLPCCRRILYQAEPPGKPEEGPAGPFISDRRQEEERTVSEWDNQTCLGG